MAVSAGGHFAPYPGGGITPFASSGPLTSGGCTYAQRNDDPHISSTAPLAASVHGWFDRISGTCPQATVKVYLQGYYCTGGQCGWVTVSFSSGDVFAGGGSGNRITARRTCAGSSLTGFRGITDIDLIGISDPQVFTFSTIVNLGCVPS